MERQAVRRTVFAWVAAAAVGIAVLGAGPLAPGVGAEPNQGGAAVDRDAFKKGCEEGRGSYVENPDGSFQCNTSDGSTIKCPNNSNPCVYIPPPKRAEPPGGWEGVLGDVLPVLGLADQGGEDIAAAPVDIAPVAADDAYRARPGRALERNAAQGVLANDTDADGDALTAALVEGPAKGELVLIDDGSFVYKAKRNARGTDRFTYEVSDGRGGVATATVEIRLQAKGR